MKTSITTLFSAILIFVSISIFAQRPQGGGDTGNTKYYIRGSVVEADSEQPVEYATIAIFNHRDSSMATGGITDLQGNFEIELQRPGRYYLIIQFIGYEKFTLTNLQLSPQNPTINLKPIQLSLASIMLEGVTVVDRKNEVIFKIDKKVIQVSDNPNAVGNTAAEVLEATPGVEVDIEGNVQLRGSENFTVLINGKPTVLNAQDALKQIPASSIENIEIITNPSARYDPEGLAGIINIVLKQDKKSGYNGSVDVSAGTNFSADDPINRYNVSGNFNWRKDKHSLIFGYDLNRRSMNMDNESTRKTFINKPAPNSDILHRTQNGDRYRGSLGHVFRLGYDYDLSKKSSFSINGLYNTSDSKSGSNSNIEQYYESNQSNITKILTESKDEGKRSSYDLNGTFLHKFDNEGHELQVMGAFSGFMRDTDNNNYRKEEKNGAVIYDKKIIDNSKSDEQLKTIQIDYSRNIFTSIFGNVKFETGYKSNFRTVDFNNTTNQSAEITGKPAVPNEFEYKDNIHALYATGSTKIGTFEVQLGLRGEYAIVETFQKNAPKNDKNPNKTETPSLFPTLHISKTINDNRFMGSYSRRITRPGIRYLNPYEEFTDRDNVSSGNPDLKAEYSNSLEFNYLRYFGQTTVGGTVFYRQTNDNISRITRLYEPGGTTLLSTYENLNQNSSLGLEANFRHTLNKWCTLDGIYSFYRFHTWGELNGLDFDKESFNHSFRVNAGFRVTPVISISANGMYNTPSVTAQGKRGGFVNTGLSYRHQMLDRRATFTVSVRNPISPIIPVRMEFWSEEKGQYESYTRTQPKMPVLTVGFSYRINDGIKRKRSQPSGDRSEEYSDDMEM